MIQVQIASQITQHGVDGIRWVLVEDADAVPVPHQPGTAGSARVPSVEGLDVAANDRAMLSLVALKSLVIVAGMGAAFWCAHLWLGPPWPDSKAATGVSLGDWPAAAPSTRRANSVPPSITPGGQVAPGKPAPAAPAASGSLLVTAGWK